MKVRPLNALIVLALLCAPSAIAQWSVKGAFEPDTALDQNDGLMALAPDTDPSFGKLVVYFNGFAAESAGITTSANPNSATLASSVAPFPFFPVAMLGVWKDCNNDGFVGLGDDGALEYRSVLLLNTTICPPATPDPLAPWLVHNDGNWVTEFTPIGYDDITTSQNEDPLNINDTGARVWADWGLPGDAPALSCTTDPMPYGTFRSTGGLLRWADCFDGFRGTRALDGIAQNAGHPGLGFQDAPADRPDKSASPLNVRNPWGSESDASAATIFDCSQGSEIDVFDPTGGALAPISDGQGRIFTTTAHPVAPTLDPAGSPAGTVNETEAETSDCDRNDRGEVVDTNGKQGGSDGDLPYLLEGPNEPISPFQPRTRTDHVFTFEEGSRGSDPTSLLLGTRTREQAGVGATSISGFWVGTGGGSIGHDPLIGREDLGVSPVTYITYYAHVSDSIAQALALHLPSGAATFSYGAEGCVRGTFDCDPTHWWIDSQGRDITPRDARLGSDPQDPGTPTNDPITAIGVRIGQAYELRDTDCYDQSATGLREEGVQWGALTSTSCPRP